MKIPEPVQKLFNTTSLIAFGTADNDAKPNINVVFWKKIVNEDTIILIDNFFHHTKDNLKTNHHVCIAFWNPETEEGYKLKGNAIYHVDGSIYETGKTFIQQKNPNRIPKGVVEIKVEAIYVLTPGNHAGEKLTD